MPFASQTLFAFEPVGMAAPVAIGVLLGATIGARWLPKTKSSFLRVIFTVVLLAMAIQMITRGLAVGA
ncbi:MAG: hypothetical protein HYU39_06235 [Thaumarchaeota archaeon]|nr:hypothetical protein [Nitrososphaerota archaeon]